MIFCRDLEGRKKATFISVSNDHFPSTKIEIFIAIKNGVGYFGESPVPVSYLRGTNARRAYSCPQGHSVGGLKFNSSRLSNRDSSGSSSFPEFLRKENRQRRSSGFRRKHTRKLGRSIAFYVQVQPLVGRGTGEVSCGDKFRTRFRPSDAIHPWMHSGSTSSRKTKLTIKYLQPFPLLLFMTQSWLVVGRPPPALSVETLLESTQIARVTNIVERPRDLWESSFPSSEERGTAKTTEIQILGHGSESFFLEFEVRGSSSVRLAPEMTLLVLRQNFEEKLSTTRKICMLAHRPRVFRSVLCLLHQ